ncbi:parafibromin [Strigomonas culicis]|uniref:Parafibromin n=1 Tax=Strigomonas culicis TaxID=28005 RepID=S9V1X3_9TRYP|nr:parafibromin [Strigomonas culicis]|eukprot:EPY35014.1 parafibromin [Strigomonas culicis]
MVVVRPGSFNDRHKSRTKFYEFVCIDDPTLLRADRATTGAGADDADDDAPGAFQPLSWQCVCCVFVQGNRWQLEPYFPARPTAARQPAELFQQVKGYLPYFVEDKVPPALAEWRVTPVRLTRSQLRMQQHMLEAFTIWEQLFEFLDLHPFFGQFTIEGEDES